MRQSSLTWAFAAAAVAGIGCSGGASRSGFDTDAGVVPPSTADGPGDGPGLLGGGPVDGGSPTDAATVITTSTIYANTDDSLYSLDPKTNEVTLVGTFDGADGSVTDCAVDGAGDVYVSTVDAIYRAALPASGTANVALTKIAEIAVTSGQKFYALAFAPAGVLGAAEGLVGGDGRGVLWSIDPASGATQELGSFGPDANGAIFALSGDVVFYVDGAGKPTGLATIRSCKGSSCSAHDDYLAAIDMDALATAARSGAPAASLLAGIYGSSATSKGAGVGHGDLFGLGAWGGEVFGFERATANEGVPALIAIDTKSGAGSVLSNGFGFTNGWSGACVTTKVTVTVPPPPAAPK